MGKSIAHISTIRDWYRNVDGEPGFCHEALKAMQLRRTACGKEIVIRLVIDEMSIREQILYDKHRFHEVDFGTARLNEHDNENIPAAQYALVFMCVSLMDNWKVPMGYFFIRSLTGSERLI